MSWDPFQREVLAELGHVLYRPSITAPESLEASGQALPLVLAAEDAALLAKLAHAAKLTVEALCERGSIVGALPHLRTDAAAKRALWPQLRALRR